MPSCPKKGARLFRRNDTNVRFAEAGHENLFPAGSRIQERRVTQTLAEIPGEGGTWSTGTILFGSLAGGIMRVPSVGGTATAVTTPDAGLNEASHRWPQFLPDGRHFVYVTTPNWTAYLGSLGSQERKQLLRADSKVLYASPGYLLFVRGTTLTAQTFDERSLQPTGEPFPIVEDVRVVTQNARSTYSVSSNGTLIYRRGTTGQTFELLWFEKHP